MVVLKILGILVVLVWRLIREAFLDILNVIFFFFGKDKTFYYRALLDAMLIF
jgi:hypothetical protein